MTSRNKFQVEAPSSRCMMRMHGLPTDVRRPFFRSFYPPKLHAGISEAVPLPLRAVACLCTFLFISLVPCLFFYCPVSMFRGVFVKRSIYVSKQWPVHVPVSAPLPVLLLKNFGS